MKTPGKVAANESRNNLVHCFAGSKKYYSKFRRCTLYYYIL